MLLLTQSDLDESLNNLYRQFQDAYVEEPKYGNVSLVTHYKLPITNPSKPRTVEQDELYLLADHEISTFRKFISLLPYNAKFVIQHIPNSYDVFSIRWYSK